ncbi:MAG: hypothetical protein H6566_28865 [Lewinellaceae bacterium]|nr:hypothetical protein [Lewinellaceae bacterium]
MNNFFKLFLLIASLAACVQAYGQNVDAYNDNGDIIDILIVYNNTQYTKFGETHDVSTWIDETIQSTNNSLRNSDINLRLALVHSQLISYPSQNTSVDLDNLREGSAGLGIVHKLRDQYHADVVMLVCNDLGGGRNDGLYSLQGENVRARWGVCRAGATSVFVHEFGHTMGVMHDADCPDLPDCNDNPDDNNHCDCGPGDCYNIGGMSFCSAIFPYAHGYSGDNYTPSTIVGAYKYRDRVNPPRKGFGTVPFYSNPGLSFRGALLGNADYADARRTMNETGPAIAQNRLSTLTWTGCVDSDWNIGENWSTGTVPRSIDDVVIPVGQPNYPKISSGQHLARNLIVQAGGTISMSGGTMGIQGHLISGGTFEATGGILIMQTNLDKPLQLQLSGSSYLHNLAIGTEESNSWVRLNSNTKINGNVTIANGSLLDHNNQQIVVGGDWTDSWGGGFDYSYASINILGSAINITPQAYPFPVIDVRSYASYSENGGWLSFAEEGGRVHFPTFGEGEIDFGRYSLVDKNGNPTDFEDNIDFKNQHDAWAFTPFIHLASNSGYSLNIEYEAIGVESSDQLNLYLRSGEKQLPSEMIPAGSGELIASSSSPQPVSRNVNNGSTRSANIGIQLNMEEAEDRFFSVSIRNISITPTPRNLDNFGKNPSISIAITPANDPSSPPPEILGLFKIGEEVCINEKTGGVIASYDVCNQTYMVDVDGTEQAHPKANLSAGACDNFMCGSVEFVLENITLYRIDNGIREVVCDADPVVVSCDEYETQPLPGSSASAISHRLILRMGMGRHEGNGVLCAYDPGMRKMYTLPENKEIDMSMVCDPIIKRSDWRFEYNFLYDGTSDNVYELTENGFQLIRQNANLMNPDKTSYLYSQQSSPVYKAGTRSNGQAVDGGYFSANRTKLHAYTIHTMPSSESYKFGEANFFFNSATGILSLTVGPLNSFQFRTEVAKVECIEFYQAGLSSKKIWITYEDGSAELYPNLPHGNYIQRQTTP